MLLPHDWLTWRLARAPSPYDRPGRRLRHRILVAGDGRLPARLRAGARRPDVELPRVAAPDEVVGRDRRAAPRSAPGTGDNMGAALGLGLRPGDVVVSIGTSGTAFAVSEGPAADAHAGWSPGSPTRPGGFLPLVCTLNAARILDRRRAMLGVDHDGAVGAGAGRPARRRRPHPAALPGRRAHPEPAGRHRHAAPA